MKTFFRQFADTDDRPLWATIVARSVVIGLIVAVFAVAYYFLILKDDDDSSDDGDDPGTSTASVSPRDTT
jgi:hypothetical protein